MRPLHQITGEAEFNEVFFSDARVPDSYRLGGVGEGWRVSMTTLMNEPRRHRVGGSSQGLGSDIVGGRRLEGARPHRRSAPRRADAAWIEAEVLRLTNMRAAENRRRGTLVQRAQRRSSIGPSSTSASRISPSRCSAPRGCSPERVHLRATRACRSGTAHGRFPQGEGQLDRGGTSEIMRNILGERVLGLPGEPRADKNLPGRTSHGTDPAGW